MEPPADPFRPDLNLTVPRNAGERAANLSLAAFAEIEYDLTQFLPAALLSFAPIRIEKARLFVTPSLQGRFTGQMDVRFLEYTTPRLDTERNEATVDIAGGASARVAFHVHSGLDLLIKAGVGPFETTVVDLAPRFDVEIASSEGEATLERPAHAAVTSAFPVGYDELQSFHGGAEVMDGCFDVPPASQPVPEPSYEPGDPVDLLAAAVFPCNLCVAWNDKSVVDPDTGVTHTLAAGSEKVAVSQDAATASTYQCRGVTGGCYGLCTVNPTTNAIEQVVYHAEQLSSACTLLQ